MTSRVTWDRDLTGHVDKFGNISMDVTIGGGPGAAEQQRDTGASAPPPVVARFLRELADDVERAGKGGQGGLPDDVAAMAEPQQPAGRRIRRPAQPVAGHPAGHDDR